MTSVPRIVVGVLAHNEERRIARCLASLPLGEPDIKVHVIVNGSRDATARIAAEVGAGRLTVHDWREGGKARSWNRFVLDTPGIEAEAFVFVDGDAEVLPGSVEALAAALAANPDANAAAGMPANGRKAQVYRAGLIAEHGLFGDLYALSGRFVARMRAQGVRLPEDLIGDDGLLCAMAKTDLADESQWRDARVVPCLGAQFLCEPTRFASPRSLRVQYRRMINYSVRHFQNRMISAIMRSTGPSGLPHAMREIYPQWLSRLAPRRDPKVWWFDRLGLARMRRAV
ncbi:family 2 glycosyl transferase [Novosphingobium sp. PC22D]|uniref:glycosyltransferase family A protein n=1 Tax=Novosphingobium sp. PC22D TaxID=1962403 RepID=UPI000BEFF5DE|nr:glycosyltransferase family A protein [Novosphingobium sp. PC22D]PEQ11342.1 family 2 glycosyl transferase [Novosphingobium sp. PC22D]